MDRKSRKQLPPDLRVARFVLFVLTFFAVTAVSAGQRPPVGQEHAGHEGMSMPMDSAAAAKLQEKILADKRESEFNHHLAGFFVIVAGIFILFQSNLAKKWPAARFVWPACFLLAGLFV